MSDLRDSYRALTSTPIVSVVAILSLALGIGANAAIFSILDALAIRSLPVRNPPSLVSVGEHSWSYPVWEQIRKYEPLFDGAIAWSRPKFNTAQGGEAQFIDGMFASGRYFDVLGVPAVLGRTFTDADDRRGGGPDGPVAVISYRLWQKRFGGAADAIGKTITLDRIEFTIIGVTPPEFFGTEVGDSFDVAVPFGTEPLVRGTESMLDERSAWWLSMMLRLKAGQTIAAATSALRGVQPQIRAATMPPRERPRDAEEYLRKPFELLAAASGPSYLRAQYVRPLTTIMVVVGLVLLIACANIANLLLARATARRHEMSVRLALGASRMRLTRQLLSESLMLAGLGAALGLLFAHWGSRLLLRLLSTQTNAIALNLSFDWRVLGFTAAVSVATAVLFGTAPAFRATRVQPNDALKQQSRAVIGDGRIGVGNLLVIAQVALSLILVVAAGLFVRTFNKLAHLDVGLDRGPVLVVRADPRGGYSKPAERPAMFDRMRQAAAAVPGVESAAASAVTPVSGMMWNFRIELPEHPSMPEKERVVLVNLVTPDYFRTYGSRILAGRDFTPVDRLGSPGVSIVNEAFARKFYNGENPVGRVFAEEGSPGTPSVPRQIVGYVKNVVYLSLRDPMTPTIYTPLAQADELQWSAGISVRASSDRPILLTKPIAAALVAVDPHATLTFRALDDQISASLVQERVVAILAGFFGGLALLLAGLGLYGVTSYTVSRRRTEIGVRMALGAAPGGVVRMVLRRVALLVALGVVVGAGVSLWASRFIATLLYGLEPRDPVTLIGAALVLGAIGALAGWLPARRAARIDPARVLREG